MALGQFKEALSDLKAMESPDKPLIEEATEGAQLSSKLTGSCETDSQIYERISAIAPMNSEARLKRAECLSKENSHVLALGEYQKFLKLSPESLHIYPLVSDLHIKDGQLSNALSTVKECLRRDPDNRECKKSFRTFKSAEKKSAKLDELKSRNKHRDIIKLLINEEFLNECENLSPHFVQVANGHLCSAYSKTKNDKLTVDYCTKVIDHDENDYEALISRAEANLRLEEFQKCN